MRRLIVALCVPLLAGCSFLKTNHPLLTATNPVVTVVTNTVVQLVTNETVKVVVTTNTVTLPGMPPIVHIMTNYVDTPVIVQVPVQVPVFMTNWQYVPSAAVTNGLNTVENLAPLLPAPFGSILGLVASIGGVGLGLYGKLLSGKYRQVISAVAAGVETGADSATKVAIQNAAAGAGVQHILDPIVQAVSLKMADQPTPAATPAKPA